MKHAIQVLNEALSVELIALEQCTQQYDAFRQAGIHRWKNYASTWMDILHRMALAENRKRDILRALDVLNN